MRKNLFIFALIILLGLAVCLQEALALRSFTGRVTGIDRRHLVVQRYDGYRAAFRIGWRTRYYPKRSPMLGERIRVDYVYRRGENVCYSVTILRSVYRPPDPAPVPIPETALTGQATVMKSRVNIRSGPGRGYPIVTMVNIGQVLELRGQIGSWYQVYIPRQRTNGWIYARLVRVDRLERIRRGQKI